MCKLTVGATEEDFNYDFDDYDDIDFGTHRKLQGWLSLASNSPSMWVRCWHCTGGSVRGAPLQDDYADGDESDGGDDYAKAMVMTMTMMMMIKIMLSTTTPLTGRGR